jgi:hypothetical protein
MAVTERPLGYAVVVALALRCWEDLRSIVLLHQLSSLAFALALGAILHAAGRRLFPPGANRRLATGCAVGAMILWGWNERVLHREWELIPEAMVPGYLAVQLWLMWRLTTREMSKWPRLLEYTLFCALGWLIYYTKPNWGFALALLPAPWITSCLLRATGGRAFWRELWPGLAVMLIVGVAGLSCQAFTPANTATALAVRYRALVCWHMDMIEAEIPRRLAAHPSPLERQLLEELPPVFAEERRLAATLGPGTYRSLGYDADRLYYFGYQRAPAFWKQPMATRTAFCRDLFLGALRNDPARYLRYVATQVNLYWRRPYGPAQLRVSELKDELALSDEFADRPYFSAVVLRRYRQTLAAAHETLDGCWLSGARAALARRVTPIMSALCDGFFLSITVPVLLISCFALVPAWRRRIAWREIAPPLGIAVWSIGSALGSALTSSVAQALEIQRYIDLFMPVSLLAQFLWPLIAWATLRSLLSQYFAERTQRAPVRTTGGLGG